MAENKKDFANDHQQTLDARVSREIYRRIFPHLKRQADYGYPFHSKDEMIKLYYRGYLDAELGLKALLEAAMEMPTEEGDAFGYVAFREIGNLLNAFRQVA